MANAGEVYRAAHYSVTEGTKPKYIVLLSHDRASDWIYVLSTSRSHSRPTDPPCNHGTLPSFYIGTLPPMFTLDTWLDLMRPEVEESSEFQKKVSSGRWELVGVFNVTLLKAVLDCASRAEDFDDRQAACLRDTLSKLP